jgi:hypothetical protein
MQRIAGAQGRSCIQRQRGCPMEVRRVERQQPKIIGDQPAEPIPRALGLRLVDLPRSLLDAERAGELGDTPDGRGSFTMRATSALVST